MREQSKLHHINKPPVTSGRENPLYAQVDDSEVLYAQVDEVLYAQVDEVLYAEVSKSKVTHFKAIYSVTCGCTGTESTIQQLYTKMVPK